MLSKREWDKFVSRIQTRQCSLLLGWKAVGCHCKSQVLEILPEIVSTGSSVLSIIVTEYFCNHLLYFANRYQGYVCPGILILIAGSSQLEMVADAWQRKLLSSPPNCRICQVGLSNGCVVKPLIQNQSISLPDILCLVLSR